MQLCKLVIRLIIDFKSNECFNRYDLLRKIWLRSLQILHQFMKQSKEILPIRQQSFLIQFGLVPNDLFNSNQFLPRKVFASLSIPLIHVIFIQMSEYGLWFGHFHYFFLNFLIFPNESILFFNLRRIAPELITVHGNPNATQWDTTTRYQLNQNESEIYPYHVFRAGIRDSMQTMLRTFLNDSHTICQR